MCFRHVGEYAIGPDTFADFTHSCFLHQTNDNKILEKSRYWGLFSAVLPLIAFYLYRIFKHLLPMALSTTFSCIMPISVHPIFCADPRGIRNPKNAPDSIRMQWQRTAKIQMSGSNHQNRSERYCREVVVANHRTACLIISKSYFVSQAILAYLESAPCTARPQPPPSSAAAGPRRSLLVPFPGQQDFGCPSASLSA